jgi:hypothetical protein
VTVVRSEDVVSFASIVNSGRVDVEDVVEVVSQTAKEHIRSR